MQKNLKRVFVKRSREIFYELIFLVFHLLEHLTHIGVYDPHVSLNSSDSLFLFQNHLLLNLFLDDPQFLLGLLSVLIICINHLLNNVIIVGNRRNFLTYKLLELV